MTRAAVTVALLLVATPYLLVSRASGQTAGTSRKVIALYWNSKDYPGNLRFDGSFQHTLLSDSTIDIQYFAEYFETTRLSKERQGEALHEFLRQKYAEDPVDVVVGSGYGVWNFLRQYRSSLFPHTPLVLVGGPSIPQDMIAPPGATGVLTYQSYRPTLELALRLHPGTEQVFVISGTLERDKAFELRARQDLAGYDNHVRIHYVTDFSLGELISIMQRLPAHSLILFVWQQVQLERGRLLEAPDVLSLLAPHSQAPIYGLSAALVGRGIVGGEVFTLEGIGARAARLAIRIINGEPAGSIPVQRAPTVMMFDAHQLSRWNIRKSQLPAGSVLQFENPSGWQRYKWYIVAAVILFAVQGALIMGLLVQRALRKRAELRAQLQQRELTHLGRIATLGEVTGALAHELGQPLAAMLFNANAAQLQLKNSTADPVDLRESIDDVVSDLERAAGILDRVRRFARKNEQRRELLNVNDVVKEALQLTRYELAQREVGITVDLVPDLPLVLGDAAELQQVLLNLVLNGCDAMSTRAPVARTLLVRTSRGADGCLISVSDHGLGLDADSLRRVFEPFVTTKEKGLGLGLAICRTIIAEHGGRIWATSQLGVGSTFSFTLPFAAAESDTSVAAWSSDDANAGNAVSAASRPRQAR